MRSENWEVYPFCKAMTVCSLPSSSPHMNEILSGSFSTVRIVFSWLWQLLTAQICTRIILLNLLFFLIWFFHTIRDLPRRILQCFTFSILYTDSLINSIIFFLKKKGVNQSHFLHSNWDWSIIAIYLTCTKGSFVIKPSFYSTSIRCRSCSPSFFRSWTINLRLSTIIWPIPWIS